MELWKEIYLVMAFIFALLFIAILVMSYKTYKPYKPPYPKRTIKTKEIRVRDGRY